MNKTHHRYTQITPERRHIISLVQAAYEEKFGVRPDTEQIMDVIEAQGETLLRAMQAGKSAYIPEVGTFEPNEFQLAVLELANEIQFETSVTPKEAYALASIKINELARKNGFERADDYVRHLHVEQNKKQRQNKASVKRLVKDKSSIVKIEIPINLDYKDKHKIKQRLNNFKHRGKYDDLYKFD